MATGPFSLVVVAGERLAARIEAASLEVRRQFIRRIGRAGQIVKGEVKRQLSLGPKDITAGGPRVERFSYPRNPTAHLRVRTGRLRGAIEARTGGSYPSLEVRIGPQNVVYAAIHEFGGTIVPRSARFLVFPFEGRLVFARRVTIPARPYLGPAIVASQNAVIAEVGDAFIPILTVSS